MGRFGKYALSMGIVYLLSIFGLVLGIQQVSANGYNPYKVSCDEACFKALHVDVKLNMDGSADFSEEMKVYREEAGNFVYIDHYYDAKYGESIDQNSIQLSEGVGSLKPELTQSGTKTRVRFKIWSHFSGTEVFRIQYRVKGLVKQLKDGQIFKYNFFNNNDSKPVIDASFSIQIPKQEEPIIYFSGLKNQNQIKKADQTYTIDVPKQQHTKPFYEVNMGFTGTPFTNATPIPEAQYQTMEAFKQEIDKVNQADSQVDSNALNMLTSALMLFFVLGGCIFFLIFLIYRRIGRQHRKVHTDVAFWNLPQDIGPAAAAMIIDPKNLANLSDSFKAGIMYLASENYIKIKQTPGQSALEKLKDADESLPDEIIALHQYLFADGDVKKMAAKETFQANSAPANRFESYKTKAIQAFQNLNLFDVDTGVPNGDFKSDQSPGAFKWLTYAMIFIFISISTGVRALLQFDIVQSAGLSAVVALGIMLVLVLIYYLHITRFKEEQIAVYEQWMGYKRYLSSYTLLKERNVEDVAVWKKHLVYATAFGVAEKVIKVLKVDFPDIYAEIESTTPIGPVLYSPSFYTHPTVEVPTSDRSFGGGMFSGGGSFGGGGFDGGGSGGGGGGFG